MRSIKYGLHGTVLALAVAGGYLLAQNGWNVGGTAAGAAPSAPAPQAMPVPVVSVVRQTIPIYLDYAARTEAIRNVTLQAKASGYLQQQLVADGTDVEAGDLLYKIDASDYQAALEQVKAQIRRDEASLDYLRSNLTRGSELASSGYLARDGFDLRQSAMRQGEASLAMSRAAEYTAELNLRNTEIRAPFAGRLGRNQAPVGALITSSAGTPLNTLVQLSPIYVTFNPSETELAEIQKAFANGTVDTEVFVPGSGQEPRKGRLTFIDNAVERNTGTVVARATIENADFSLLPGQYVRIRLHLRELPNALMVPQTALGSSQFGRYVYVIGKDNVVEQRIVSLGPANGPLVSLTSGVSEGDQIISGNLQKIFPGAPVKPISDGDQQS
ncbi:efflux RND transporter periplasmic adaptor subunit [Mesorhizobium sp. J428]|uniref:efflux RND transporter periplasmic adaptor subunit n=1 Tax=Mesorhizobium sp. J428 TaxID=2898440 RepID=UPI00215106C7|nr:efflux RND transporter periplasmic adaptor subunit [Mesorhizobium sp. J428]MCR5856402.1 efflux RND transporter periplasmic adaptor subunit [Mesorhizobium sp. J428]